MKEGTVIAFLILATASINYGQNYNQNVTLK
jgi:hypothetical protein